MLQEPLFRSPPREILVQVNAGGSVLQHKPHLILTRGTRGKNLTLQQSRLVRLAVTVVINPVHS